jgi:hypothetical protein
MMEERWHWWNPIEGLLPFYYLDHLVDDGTELSIFVSDENDENKLTITFKKSLKVYRFAYEYYKREIRAHLEKHSGHDLMRGSFFTATNSEYMQWYCKYASISEDDMHHFVFWVGEWIIEVISSDEPSIEKIA